MTTGVGNTLTMGYDSLRRLTSVTGGPASRQFTYRDIDSTKTTLQVASVTSGGQQYGYTYDSMGNITTYSAPGKGTVTYTYDNQGQLLKAAGDTTYTYTYDSAGNILTANGHTYTYGNADWKDLLTAFDGQSITYDAIGNPTSYYNGTRWNLSWANGRSLATASDGTTSLSFAYDASGLRTSKTVNGTTYRYYYAGGKLMRMTWSSNTPFSEAVTPYLSTICPENVTGRNLCGNYQLAPCELSAGISRLPNNNFPLFRANWHAEAIKTSPTRG